MMTGSTGGERDLNETLAAFEGLVLTTSRMFAAQLHRDEDDLAQELRVKVWRAVERFDPTRGLSIERHVFGALTNKIKDYKRDAAREVQRREKHGVSFLHIEDMATKTVMTHYTWARSRDTTQELFDAHYHFVTDEEVYAEVEREPFEVPAGVTGEERQVLALLMADFTRAEIALLLGMSKFRVDTLARSLQQKFADWRPSRQQHQGDSVVLVAQPVAA